MFRGDQLATLKNKVAVPAFSAFRLQDRTPRQKAL
jgi:hypothetical protein